MTQEASWGTRLERHEIEARDKQWEQGCEELKARVLARLGDTASLGGAVDIAFIHPMCESCPECPRECALCLADADMNNYHTEPGVKVTIAIPPEPAGVVPEDN